MKSLRTWKHDTGSVCLLAWCFFLGVQVQTPIELRLALSDIILCLGFLALAARRAIRVPPLRHSAPVAAVFAALLMGTIVIAVRTGKSPSAWAVANKDFGYIILMASYVFLVSALSDRRRVSDALHWLVYGAAGTTLITMLIWAISPAFAETLKVVSYGRIQGFLLDPNAFGGYLVFALFICTGLLLQGGDNRRDTLILRFSLVVLGAGIALSYSRSAWIAFAVAMVAYLLMDKRNRPILLLACVAFGVAFLPRVPGLISAAGDAMTGAGEASFDRRLSRPDTIELRLEYARGALVLFAGHPVLGAGLGAFREYSQQNFHRLAIVHNSYLWFLGEMGLIGFAALMFLFWRFGQDSYNLTRQTADGLNATAVGLFAALISVYALSLGIEASYQRTLWLAFAIVSALWIQRSRPISEDQGVSS